jgi:hypothetical protein
MTQAAAERSADASASSNACSALQFPEFGQRKYCAYSFSQPSTVPAFWRKAEWHAPDREG